ncbi:MAG: DUF3179 domain-containing protein [Chloroflexi bacterium]|nr:DUF3179 domain-containing protein [Chloroflexota bacterium]
MGGRHLTFEVFGLLQGVLTMVDRETGTMWTHLDGLALRGPLGGTRLAMIPLPQMTWGQWKKQHPASLVLSPNTPFQDRYRPVRIGIFQQDEARFGDSRLPANTLVVGVEVRGQFRAYPLEKLEEALGVVNDTLAGEPIVVVYDRRARTGLAYSRAVGGRVLKFSNNTLSQGVELVDGETGSRWDLLGHAVSDSLATEDLKFVPSFISEWYGWSGYHPESTVFGGP